MFHYLCLERVKTVKVVDSRGIEQSTHAGPYLEGQALKLICIATGGKSIYGGSYLEGQALKLICMAI